MVVSVLALFTMLNEKTNIFTNMCLHTHLNFSSTNTISPENQQITLGKYIGIFLSLIKVFSPFETGQ